MQFFCSTSQYVFDRPYSRTLEAEADKIGLQLAAKVKRSTAENTVSLAQLTKMCAVLTCGPSTGQT